MSRSTPPNELSSPTRPGHRPAWACVPALAALAAGVLVFSGGAPRAAAIPTAAARAAGLADAISLDWTRSQADSGAIIDPQTGMPEGSYGGTMLAYGMLRAASRSGSSALARSAQRALLTSARALSPFNLLGVSEALIGARGGLEPSAVADLGRAIAGYGPYDRTGPQTPCFRRVGCYGNHKLVGAAAAWAALRALTVATRGVSDPAASARLRRAARRAHHLTARTIPSVEVGSGPLQVGETSRSGGAVLSDPPADPTAYVGLSVMMLGRAIELDPAPAPAALRAFRRAVIALLGLTAPDGDISYMGRGQGQTWAQATTLAGCALAEQLLRGDSRLRGWCAGVIQAELSALAARRALVNFGIATVPRAQAHTGVDRAYNFEDANGLCVYALNVAADALANTTAVRVQPPPGALEGERFTDDRATGLATTDHLGVWFAVHRQTANAGDSRSGFGLLALEVHAARGWQRVLTGRPLAATAQGPILRVHGRDLRPFGRLIAATRPGRIVVIGGWRGGGRVIPATFVYQGDANGVTLSVPTSRSQTLLLREWVLPGSAAQVSTAAPAGTRTQVGLGALPVGNAESDTVQQLTHSLDAAQPGVDRFSWRP